MERDIRPDHDHDHVREQIAPAHDRDAHHEEEAPEHGPRFSVRGMVPPVEADVDRQERTASEKGYDAPRAPLSLQEKSGLSAHKFKLMQGTPQLDTYVAAVQAHDAAVARYGALVRDKKSSSIDIEAAKHAMSAAQKAELRARIALRDAADHWQPEVQREPEFTTIDPDGPSA